MTSHTTTLLCRFCQKTLKHSFVDLGMSPISNNYRDLASSSMEPYYPLHTYVCEHCFLVQLPAHQTQEEIFTSDYAYFSSYSQSWLKHAKDYVNMMIDKYNFGPQSQVIELASNDGYLLQYFKERGVPVLGVEPCRNVAEAAERIGIPTLVQFFGTTAARSMADDGQQADLLIGNNVLAHVPNLNDFVEGFKTILKPQGIITMEFPHLLRLMADCQFDTIYHEHFSYFSLLTVRQVFAAHGLTVFDVEEIPTHGGSLRIYARHTENDSLPVSDRVKGLKQREEQARLNRLETYTSWQQYVHTAKRNFLAFLLEATRAGKKVVGYGAPAKGNTFLNYCGVRSDLIEYTVDRSPHKQGRLLPGTHIPIYDPSKIRESKPDYVLILPWNLKDEISEQMSDIRAWGGKFVVAIPSVTVF